MNKPECIGFIMDGNRRYAIEKNLPTFEGHKKGLEMFTEVVRWVHEAGIPHAVFYAFSTENWKRSEEEVSYLMDLFDELLSRLQKKAEKEKVRLRVIGRTTDFSESQQERIQELEAETKEYSETTIWIALSYGGRAEILEAVNKAIDIGEPVTEEVFSELLWTNEMPDPDIIVRTSGEERLSNFLPWQSVYSEFLFLEKHWPALTESDFKDILAAYESRQRRQGA